VVDIARISNQLQTSLSEMPLQGRVAFAAASVQRAEKGFADVDSGRPGDKVIFSQMLNGLWDMALGHEVADIEEWRGTVGDFPEITAEDEAEDRAFYAESAVVLLLFALDVAKDVPTGIDNLIKRSHHMMDALDLDLDSDGLYLEQEITRQQQTIAALEHARPMTADAVLHIREASIGQGEEIGQALAQIEE
jgi:hypothetical protein